jgi:hypothetical protein
MRLGTELLTTIMSNLANSVCGLDPAWDLGLLPAMIQDLDAMIVLATSGRKNRKKCRCLLLFGLFALVSSSVLLSPVFPAPAICPVLAPGPHARPLYVFMS